MTPLRRRHRSRAPRTARSPSRRSTARGRARRDRWPSRSSSRRARSRRGRSCPRSSTSRTRARGRRRCRGTRSGASPSASTRARAASTRRRALIASAKSWLSTPASIAARAILPLGAPEDVEKISPVEASWRYLEHLCEAWDARFGGGDAALARKQDVVLTVPASFDASARELTVEAALAAGIERVTLLEEPQAALYAWIAGAWATRGARRSCVGRRHPGRRRRRRHDRLLGHRRGGRRTARSSSCASRWATTSCSAATTWTSRWRTWSRQKLDGRGQGRSTAGRWRSLTHACRVAKERLLVGRRRSRPRPSRSRARLEAARRRRSAPSSRATR